MKKTLSIFTLLLCVLSFAGCSEESNNENGISSANDNQFNYYSQESSEFTRAERLAKGADISWLTQMEADGIKFFYDSGVEGDCMAILKSLGVNAYRFRLWVNPVNKYCTTEDVILKCKRAKEQGADIMLDFHYSDSWADPSKQNIPAAWKNLNQAQLIQKVSEYTKDVLRQLKNEGICIKWVQIGNETGNGMLWPIGQADKNIEGYVALNNAGYDAVKAVFPDCKVIVHIQNGQDLGLAKWIFGLLDKNGGKFDIAGFSLYPDKDNYDSYINKVKETMLWCINSFGCETMLCEVGMGNSYVSQCKDFLTKCFKLSEQIPDNKMSGVFYWEPQVYNDWQGYRLGAFTSKGTPGEALSAFSYTNSAVRPVLPD